MRTKSLATETTLSTISPAEAEAKIAPVVALLEVPLLELRKSLGTNTSADPDADVVAALTSASTATSATGGTRYTSTSPATVPINSSGLCRSCA